MQQGHSEDVKLDSQCGGQRIRIRQNSRESWGGGRPRTPRAHRRTRSPKAREIRFAFRRSHRPGVMILHRDREDEDARSLFAQQLCAYTRDLGVRHVEAGPCSTGEDFLAEEGVEAEMCHDPVATKETAVERVEAERTLSGTAQAPCERWKRIASESMI